MSLETNQRWRQCEAPALSVVVIGHRSAGLLARAVTSLLRTSSRELSWELVLVLNGCSPEVREYAGELSRSESVPLALLPISERRPGAARNSGVKACRAPLLLFLDDDIHCFQDLVSATVELFRDPEVHAAGGANLTPPGSGALARATGGVMASRLGAASMRRRYRLGGEGAADEHDLILCNLAVRRSVFEDERGFAAHLISNEENVLLQRLSAKGSRLWSSSRLAVFHCRRDTWRGLCSQAAKYGAGRAQNLLLLPETLRFLYFLPLLFWLYLVSLVSLWHLCGASALAPLALYLTLAVLQGLLLAVREWDPAHLLSIAVFPCVHLAYGWGFLRALCVWAMRRKKLREHSV
ncbi:MAG TPA: glycosyltransferase [Bdellovibrionota bacterium]